MPRHVSYKASITMITELCQHHKNMSYTKCKAPRTAPAVAGGISAIAQT